MQEGTGQPTSAILYVVHTTGLRESGQMKLSGLFVGRPLLYLAEAHWHSGCGLRVEQSAYHTPHGSIIRKHKTQGQTS